MGYTTIPSFRVTDEDQNGGEGGEEELRYGIPAFRIRIEPCQGMVELLPYILVLDRRRLKEGNLDYKLSGL